MQNSNHIKRNFNESKIYDFNLKIQYKILVGLNSSDSC